MLALHALPFSHISGSLDPQYSHCRRFNFNPSALRLSFILFFGFVRGGFFLCWALPSPPSCFGAVFSLLSWLLDPLRSEATRHQITLSAPVSSCERSSVRPSRLLHLFFIFGAQSNVFSGNRIQYSMRSRHRLS